jgi:hypothetical protein
MPTISAISVTDLPAERGQHQDADAARRCQDPFPGLAGSKQHRVDRLGSSIAEQGPQLSADFSAHRFLLKCEPRNRTGDDQQRPERKDRIIGKRCTSRAALCLDQFAAVSLRRDHTAMAPDELGPAPKTQRTITSVHRVLAWKRDLEDRREGAIVVGRAGAAFVVTAEGRVCADYQQVLAGGQSLVAGSGRQDHHIAGLEVKRFTAFAAEANPGMAARDLQLPPLDRSRPRG